MNNNFNKTLSDAMGLFNTFGAFVPKTYNVNPEIVRPQLPSLSRPNLDARAKQKPNED